MSDHSKASIKPPLTGVSLQQCPVRKRERVYIYTKKLCFIFFILCFLYTLSSSFETSAECSIGRAIRKRWCKK